ncbi:hypothetical protein CV019_11340, partial [Staphylococcus haemolyticus]
LAGEIGLFGGQGYECLAPEQPSDGQADQQGDDDQKGGQAVHCISLSGTKQELSWRRQRLQGTWCGKRPL